MNDWEAQQKACENAVEVFENAIQNFIDEWNNCAQRMIEKYGNRMTLEEFEFIIHPKQHFPKPPKKIIPKYTEPFRNVRRIVRSDCK